MPTSSTPTSTVTTTKVRHRWRRRRIKEYNGLAQTNKTFWEQKLNQVIHIVSYEHLMWKQIVCDLLSLVLTLHMFEKLNFHIWNLRCISVLERVFLSDHFFSLFNIPIWAFHFCCLIITRNDQYQNLFPLFFACFYRI